MSDYEALRAAAEAATPGPWVHYRDKLRPQFSGRVNEVQAATRPAVVRWSGFDDSARPEKQHAANAAYIAAMSPDVALDLLAQLAEQRSINAALVEAGNAMFTAEVRYALVGGMCSGCGHTAHLPTECDAAPDPIDPADHCGCSGDDNESAVEDATDRLAAVLADLSKAATEWRTQVAKEAVSAERERLLGLFDLGWRKETSDPYPDGVTAVIGYSIRRVRDRLLGHREDDPECDCESCRSIAAEETAQ